MFSLTAAALVLAGESLAQTEYGAEAANKAFCPGGSSGKGQDFNYLALRDHIGPSGVPLGGIGAGCFDLAPDGQFTRIGINNTFDILKGRSHEGFLLCLVGEAQERSSSGREKACSR